MFAKLKKFILKYREPIAYILVGGGTTVVAWGCKYLWNLLFYAGTAFPTTAQLTVLSLVENIGAIAYSYPANRKWVFHSTSPNILKELMKFTGSRAVVWILGWLLNMLLVRVFDINVFLTTLIVGIVGANVNFALSKLLTFNQKSHRQKCSTSPEAVILDASTYAYTDIAAAA